MAYCVEIEKTGAAYTAKVHQGDASQAKVLENVQLGPEVEIGIKGNSYSLGSLMNALAEYQESDLKLAFDERGQWEIGQHLYRQIFGSLNHDTLPSNNVEVRIKTEDEHIARLPWCLLANNGIFLCTVGWSVALSSLAKRVDCCELPPSPKMLIIAPQPANVPPTKAEPHLEALEDMLSAADHRLSFGKHLKLVRTWEEFTESLSPEALKKFEPQIVYYYGHGEVGFDSSKLLFASGKNKALKAVPVADFALRLRQLNHPPCLAYINCCKGDVGGFLGVGMQLEDFIPAVITNRTVAQIDAAQAQAMALWESMLLKGVAPHKAVANLYCKMGALNLSLADVRWMTPLIHCHYATWKSSPPKAPNRLEHDPHWHLKIDRVTQFGTVATQTRQMLRERKPRSLAFVWYGEQGQGLELFHQRLKVELDEDLSDAFIDERRPEWPPELPHNYHRAFQDMLLEAFEVSSLEDIPASVRAKTYGAFGTQTLVYVRHRPVKSKRLINPNTLKAYLEWWNSHFVPVLDSNQFALLGVSFVVKNPPKFRNVMLDKARLYDLYLDHTVFRLLDEMERVARKDLLDFLHTHNIRLPEKRRDKVIERILEKTQGHYEHTVEELKHLVDMARDFSEEELQERELEEEDFDY